MLLDALCNMFGGIIFIALLVVIMSSNPSATESETESTPIQESAEEQIARMQLEQLNLELSKHGLDDSQLTHIDAAINRREAASAMFMKKLRELSEAGNPMANAQTALQERRDELDRLEEMEAEIQASSQQMHEDTIDEAVKSTAAAIAELELELQQAARRKLDDVRLPYGQQNRSIPYRLFIILQNNRAYIAHAPSDQSWPPHHDARDVQFVEEPCEGTLFEYRLRPGGGFPVDEQLLSHPRFRELTVSYPNNRFIVAYWLAPDSHQAFRIINEAMTNAGYRHQLNLSEGGILRFVRGTADMSTQ
ncbi:MAG: hypothetical protein CMJ24_07925 [Phycisphaerae bacterium]|nr:hypothetical protein [Phycisphaerae bacterium]